MVMVRAINQADFTGQRLGYLLLVVDEERFAQETCRQVSPEEQGQVVLVGADGTVISSADPRSPPACPCRIPPCWKRSAAFTPQAIPIFPSRWAAKAITPRFLQPKARWYALALVREGYLNAEMDRLNAFILLVSFLCLGLGLVAMLVIAASIVRPVNRLVRYCRGVAARTGERSIRDGGRDEIGYLTGEVGRMVARLDEYGEREVQNSIQMKNLEIQMLQAQINPHFFLFNTLNSIKWTAVLSRVPAVADSLSALAGLLKKHHREQAGVPALRGELKTSAITRSSSPLRYTEQFVMEYRVDDACLETPILKFLLQPIVENAILHGVEGVGRLVTITVESAPLAGRPGGHGERRRRRVRHHPSRASEHQQPSLFLHRHGQCEPAHRAGLRARRPMTVEGEPGRARRSPCFCPPKTRRNGRMYKLLIVDDENLVRVAFRTMVDYEQYGFTVCGTAADGEEALRLCAAEDPDLIITDIKMPRMDGITHRAAHRGGFTGKIVLISNYDDFDLVRQGMVLGAQDYLLKLTITTQEYTAMLGRMKQALDETMRRRRQDELARTALDKLERQQQAAFWQSCFWPRPE